MKRLRSQAIGIDQGDNVLFSDYEDGGEMWTGTGPRERSRAIRFSERFRDAPMVHCALTMWDVDQATNTRAEIAAENVTEEGFDLVFRTWGDTRVARARVGWIAFGEVHHADDWDLY
ncbi:H-type lectin domain-containing protein [Stappia sp.]|uniref:H-type lectin domain-containing protein n=1 Tax=Stappia sp. TaxID=1870903 RepID=UPI003A9964A1